MSYFKSFDVAGQKEDKIAFAYEARKDLMAVGKTYIESKDESRESFFAMYGGMLFLGIFLGALFLGAMVLIMYYKQISEGYEDKARFIIMQKVGMSKKEVQASINSQILKVFFLPLVMAMIHIVFAFSIITKLLAVLNFTNVTLFAWCCGGSVLAFGAIYGLVYFLTARVYYKVVSEE